MLSLLFNAAFAVPTTVFPTDGALIAWIERNDASSRTQLPVVGPYTLRKLEDELSGDLFFVHITPSQDPVKAAINARLERGSPCALVIAPMETGWAGWTSGACGMLSIGGWRWENERVIDGTGRPVLVPTFAAQSGDREILRRYQHLDRQRGRAIWAGVLGSGMLFAGSVNMLDGPDPTSRAIQVSGGAITLVGALAFARVQAKHGSRPRRIDAYYSEDEIQQRIRRHNRRMQIAWTPTGMSGIFF